MPPPFVIYMSQPAYRLHIAKATNKPNHRIDWNCRTGILWIKFTN